MDPPNGEVEIMSAHAEAEPDLVTGQTFFNKKDTVDFYAYC